MENSTGSESLLNPSEMAGSSVQMIPMKQYEVLLKLLEDEKILHVKTKAELRKTQEELDFALGEIEVLKGQIAREKRQFDNAFGIMKKKAFTESSKNVELENKCNAVEQAADQAGEELRSKEDELNQLAEKLQQQQIKYQQQVMEERLQREQDAYISKVVKNTGSDKVRVQSKVTKPGDENLYQLQQEYITKVTSKPHKS